MNSTTTSSRRAELPGLALRVVHRCVLAVTVVVAALLGLSLLPNAWGWSTMVVTSSSMSPSFEAGDLVIVQPRDAEDLEPLDIITFVTPDRMRVSHRVVSKGTDADGITFVTKGDANKSADVDPVDGRNVEGQVRYSVPRLGYIVVWARTPLGLALLALGLGYVAFGGRSKTQGDSGIDDALDSVEGEQRNGTLVGS